MSLFTVIRFRNSECHADNGLGGTCYLSSECKSGASNSEISGSCARGFGICCSGEDSIFIFVLSLIMVKLLA